jgi:hypothetical protein
MSIPCMWHLCNQTYQFKETLWSIQIYGVPYTSTAGAYIGITMGYRNSVYLKWFPLFYCLLDTLLPLLLFVGYTFTYFYC